jgi:hypothetical protein
MACCAITATVRYSGDYGDSALFTRLVASPRFAGLTPSHIAVRAPRDTRRRRRNSGGSPHSLRFEISALSTVIVLKLVHCHRNLF